MFYSFFLMFILILPHAGVPCNLTSEAVGAIQAHILLLASSMEENHLTYLKMVLRCAVEICKGCPDVSDMIVQTLTNLIGLSEGKVGYTFFF